MNFENVVLLLNDVACVLHQKVRSSVAGDSVLYRLDSEYGAEEASCVAVPTLGVGSHIDVVRRACKGGHRLYAVS